MLKMPELGVQVRGWKMRQILESDESAVIAEYGPVDPDTGLREKVPLVKVVYRLRDDVLLPSMTGCDHIRIGRFSHASNAFSTDDIFNVELLRGVEAKECLDKLVASESAPSLQKDKDDKRPVTSDALGAAADETAQGGASDDVAVITFNTHWLGSFALLQAVSSNLPYRSWRIYPQLMTQADSSGLPATGADDPGAVAIAFEVDLPWTTIHMRVTAEGCMLARPIQTPGQDLHQCTTARHLTALVGQSQPAGVLLGRLREAGLLLSPTDALAPLVSCATKDRAMQADVASVRREHDRCRLPHQLRGPEQAAVAYVSFNHDCACGPGCDLADPRGLWHALDAVAASVGQIMCAWTHRVSVSAGMQRTAAKNGGATGDEQVNKISQV